VGLRNLLYSAYERKLRRQLEDTQRPRHVGVILDGNRRWAREAGLLDVNDGHRAGASRITELLGWCRDNDVEVVTLWLLSTDNLKPARGGAAPAAGHHRRRGRRAEQARPAVAGPGGRRAGSAA